MEEITESAILDKMLEPVTRCLTPQWLSGSLSYVQIRSLKLASMNSPRNVMKAHSRKSSNASTGLTWMRLI